MYTLLSMTCQCTILKYGHHTYDEHFEFPICVSLPLLQLKVNSFAHPQLLPGIWWAAGESHRTQRNSSLRTPERTQLAAPRAAPCVSDTPNTHHTLFDVKETPFVRWFFNQPRLLFLIYCCYYFIFSSQMSHSETNIGTSSELYGLKRQGWVIHLVQKITKFGQLKPLIIVIKP